MATLNSKNSSIVYLNNRMAAFFLGEITGNNTTQYTFYTDAGKTDVKYSLNLNPAIGTRCLQYRCFSATSYLPTFCPYVLYTPQTTIDVLYQTNFVAAQASNHGTILCTFWSTLMQNKKANQNGGGSSYVVEGKIIGEQHLSYDAAAIEKINQQAYTAGGLILSGKRNCIFCMAQIILQPLYIETSDGFTKQDVAVIKKKPVVLQQFESEHHMIDFCSGGGGGGGAGSGLAQHNHIPHVDGSGFAFAVFHPGTSMPQLPWN